MKDKKRKSELEIEALLNYINRIIATLREPFVREGNDPGGYPFEV